MAPVFKNIGERSTAKNHHPVSLLSVVSKVFEKHVNNRIVDHLEKCGLFSDFQCGFRSSQSTADLLTVVSDRIARGFSRSGATRAGTFDICKAFDRVWHAGLLHKLKSSGISGQIYGLISSFLSTRRLRVVMDGKSSQEYPLMLEFLKAPFLVLHFSYYTLMTFLTMLSVLLPSMLTILFFIPSVIRHLIYETLDLAKKWLVDFSAGKTHLVSFHRSNNNGSIDVKMDGSVQEEKSSFKMLGLTFFSKLN